MKPERFLTTEYQDYSYCWENKGNEYQTTRTDELRVTNETGNARLNVTLTSVRATFVTLEKAIIITCSECVFVALRNQHEKCRHCT
jgi:uncharacterized protein YfaS (alpha-2-macroglobulin family)